MSKTHDHCLHNNKGDYCGWRYEGLVHGRFQHRQYPHIEVEFCCHCGGEVGFDLDNQANHKPPDPSDT